MQPPNTPYPISAIDKGVIWLKNFITNPNIEVGDYTYYHDMKSPEKFEKENVILIYTCKLIIGKFCQIAHNTKFIMSDANHPMDGFSTFPFMVFVDETKKYNFQIKHKGDTIVGNDVWFGHDSCIMPGVKIGNGAIIGARTVVTKDVAPYTIVGGNPAKVIRKRFSDDVIEKLEQIQWWNWDIEKIENNIEAIVGQDLNKLMALT